MEPATQPEPDAGESLEEVRGWIALRKAGWHDSDIADEAEADVHMVAQPCSAVARRDYEAGVEPGEGPQAEPPVPDRGIRGIHTGDEMQPHHAPVSQGLARLPTLLRPERPGRLAPGSPPRSPEGPAEGAEGEGQARQGPTRAERRKALAQALKKHRSDARRSEYEAKKARALAAAARRGDNR
ncbi:hypothetical protein [Planctomyces sp. SH-PL62]|uniref:hypothetical protein n=1 Tax=Planctomyces sp. SH-PL62 TaxID=1636152 RepID=UPI0012E95F2C|nr:hypothetical protein [Planctomyces sp. SH-PL62]